MSGAALLKQNIVISGGCQGFKHYLTSSVCRLDKHSFLYYSYEMYTEHFDRITCNPAVMGGKACIRGMRVTVGMVVNQIGAGYSIDEVLAYYPYLEREDILQALKYAAWRVEEREIALVTIDQRKTRVSLLPLK